MKMLIDILQISLQINSFCKQLQCRSIIIRKEPMLGEAILYSVIAVFIGISQSAGIGGGPVLNICLMIGAGFSAKESMSITYIFLMGGAVASIYKNFNRLQPNKQTLVMDYDMIMVTLPMAATGSLFGTLTNHFLSQLAVTILFTILLSYLCVNTYRKLKQCSKQASSQLCEPMIRSMDIELQNPQQQQMEGHKNRQLQQILAYERDPLPNDKLKLVAFMFLVTLLVLLVKGGHSYHSIIGIQSCGLLGNLFVFAHLGLSFYCSSRMAKKIILKDQKKQQLGYSFDHPTDKMSDKKMWSCIISGFCAGLIGGALGLGGAIILVPVWLNLGIHQSKATNSSPPLIFFSALISFTICLLSGRYHSFVDLTFFFVLAYAGSAVVKSVVTYISEKYKLKTMVFILLLITMASSLIALLPFQISKLFRNPQTFVKFGEFC